MYNFGMGVREDDAEAVRWYRQAAEQGLASAQNNLGAMYAFGAGVLEDDVEAVRWYRLAAEQGHAEASFKLGLMWGLGEGVPVDYVRAYAWLNVASARGAPKAAGLMNYFAKRMTREAIMEAQTLSREVHDRTPQQ